MISPSARRLSLAGALVIASCWASPAAAQNSNQPAQGGGNQPAQGAGGQPVPGNGVQSPQGNTAAQGGNADPVMTGVQEPAGEGQPIEGERRYRGIFGGSNVGPAQPGFALQLGGYGGYDDDLLANQSGQTGGPGFGGTYAGGSGGLIYNKISEKLTVSANTNSDGRRYSRFDRTTFNHSGDIAVDFAVGRKTRILAIERAARSSLFRYAALPGVDLSGPDVPPPTDDFGISDLVRVMSDSSVQYTRELSSRSSLIANGGYRISESPGTVYDLRVTSAGAAYTRQFSRTANLRLGYTYRASEYGTGPTARRNVIAGLDLGGGYRKPLSFSRRTTFNFTGGYSRINQERVGLDPVSFNRVTGTAGLEHEMGRTWTLAGGYTRGVQFVETFPDPFFVDSATVTLNGLATKRLELASTMSYVNGQLQLNSTGNAYRSIGTSHALTYSLSQALAIAFSYSYFNYDFGSRAALPNGLARALERQSLRLGLQWWLPISHAPHTPQTR